MFSYSFNLFFLSSFISSFIAPGYLTFTRFRSFVWDTYSMFCFAPSEFVISDLPTSKPHVKQPLWLLYIRCFSGLFLVRISYKVAQIPILEVWRCICMKAVFCFVGFCTPITLLNSICVMRWHSILNRLLWWGLVRRGKMSDSDDEILKGFAVAF